MRTFIHRRKMAHKWNTIVAKDRSATINIARKQCSQVPTQGNHKATITIAESISFARNRKKVEKMRNLMCSSGSVCLFSHTLRYYPYLTLCAPASMTGAIYRKYVRGITPPKPMYPPHSYKQQGVVLIVVLVFFHLLLSIFQLSRLFIHGDAQHPAAYVTHHRPCIQWVVWILCYISRISILYISL